MEAQQLSLLFLILGIAAGIGIGRLLAKSRYQQERMKDLRDNQPSVWQERIANLTMQLEQTRRQLTAKESEYLESMKILTGKDRDIRHLQEKLTGWEQEMRILQERSHALFEQTANRLLEEKTRTFTEHNHERIDALLKPLRERIREFGQDIEQRLSAEAKEKVSLRKELEMLTQLNQQLGEDARNLAAALKGDSKVQGDWGEWQLERLLEKAGLQRDVHFSLQMSFRNEAGKGQRPDCIIHLPEGRHLVIDAKVSLTAYERYFQATDEKERKRHLQEHVQSVRQHLRELGRKDYQQLYQIDTPDYLLMFVPIDTAFNLAVQQENNLYLEALDKNIVMVTTATLLATLRTVSYLWRQDKQQRNVQEIARQSGMLYDKFVGFLEDLKLVGARLEQAREAWAAASNKLSDSPKFGDTLIGRAERIRMLGARTAKRLPPELLSGDLSETDAGDQPA
ncbi:MAG: hypothetical protein RLY31_259 [Bacteroidota bacterium]|jgi:DNA recombination protein RmuC